MLTGIIHARRSASRSIMSKSSRREETGVVIQLEGLDPLERSIERVLQPGRYIRHGEGFAFTSALEEVEKEVSALVGTEPVRAVRLYETFLAGCYEKVPEVHDSDGLLGIFVEQLCHGWIQAEQASGTEPDQLARRLLELIDGDPYGLTYQVERAVVAVMNEATRNAFARQIEERLRRVEPGSVGQRRHWTAVLKTVALQNGDVTAFLSLSGSGGPSPDDCLALAGMCKDRQMVVEALSWVERGIALDRESVPRSTAGYSLVRMKRELLVRAGRAAEALEDAWGGFRTRPDRFTYEDLMRLVPDEERAAWHTRAMKVAEEADLRARVELWSECREAERLATVVREASDEMLEELSHFVTEPAARCLEESHPAMAARVFRALGMRVVKAGKSRYYSAALGNFESAKRCYQRAGLTAEWDVVVAEMRRAHRRKTSFNADFERLVGGEHPSDEPSFLERARRRWLKPERS